MTPSDLRRSASRKQTNVGHCDGSVAWANKAGVGLCRADASAGQEADSRLERGLAAATLASELPSSPGASFPAVFGQWVALGLLSRRRVAALAEEAARVRHPIRRYL